MTHIIYFDKNTSFGCKESLVEWYIKENYLQQPKGYEQRISLVC